MTYQDIGQIDFYVRYFDDQVKLPEDNPTLGIILCAEKNDTMAKYSVLSDKDNLFASKYMLYLPTEEELKRELERGACALHIFCYFWKCISESDA